jgi:hypothetical protein
VLGIYLGVFLTLVPALSTARASAVGAVVALSPPVLMWSTVINFAPAVSCFTFLLLGCMNRFSCTSRRRWLLAAGTCLALLSLSRTVALVQVAAVLVVLVGSAYFVERDRRRRGLGALLVAVVLGAALAAPWWLSSGPEAVRYLRDAGFDSSSGFAGRGLGPRLLVDRVRWSFADLGALWFLLLLGTTILVMLRHRDLLVRAERIMLAAAGISLFLLSSSGNHGTGFGAPAILLLVACAASAGARLLPPGAGAVLGSALTAVAIAAWVGVSIPGVPRPFYESSLAAATGGQRVDPLPIHARVLALAHGRPILLARDDGVFNANGLSYLAAGSPLTVVIPSYGPTGQAEALSALDRVGLVVTGLSGEMYHAQIDMAALDRAAAGRGFRLIEVLPCGPRCEIRLWSS